MIVVVGNPILREPGRSPREPALAGTAALVAAAAARAGATVQLVGRTGDDANGDALVLALANAGVGHVALLRVARPTPTAADASIDDAGPLGDLGEDPGPPESPVARGALGLDEADVDLALRYLTEFGVLVVAPDLSPEATAVAVRAAAWTGAKAIVLLPDATPERGDLPEGTIVLTVPGADAHDVFAGTVGEYAASLDRGDDPEIAFRAILSRSGWEPTAAD